MIFNFYLYDRKGTCLYYKEWNRPLNTLADDPAEEKRLMFGMLYSLKDLAAKMSHHTGPEGLHTVRTNAYTLHHFQSVTGLSFVLNTDSEAADLYPNLRHIYSQLYVECVSRNLLCRQNADERLKCPLFEKKLEEYISTLPCYVS
jgi:hypothetical protein